MRVTALITCVAFYLAVLWPHRAHAQAAAPPPSPSPSAPVADDAMQAAKTHFEAGKNAYNAGDYVAAIREFKAAEALRPSPILAYNIGLANEKLLKRRVAVKYYRRYLEQMPQAANRAEVEGRIAQLESEIAAQPPPGGQPPPGTPPPPAPPGAPPPTAEQPGDMPPAPPPGQQPVYAGSDPYGQAAPVVQPAPPPKRKSYWWVWLIVAGGATLVIGLVVYFVVVYGSVTSTVGERGQPLGLDRATPPESRSPGLSHPLFRF
jgi:tetratricopeptide (TPR) repeat protein